MEKERISYIDYTKGYGILLIVLAHVAQYFSACSSLVGYVISYHVSIFFIVSGVLGAYKTDGIVPWRVFLQKKIRTLMIPYIWFSLFNSILKLSVLAGTHQLTETAFYTEMMELFITGNGTVWFLLTLFGAEVLYRLVIGVFKEMQIVILAVICAGISFIVGEIESPVMVVLLRISVAFSLYVSGIVFGKYVLRKYNPTIFYGIILLFLGILSYWKMGSEYSFFSGTFKDPMASLSAIFLNSFGCIIIFKNIDKNIVFWKYIGENSLIIMLVHPTILLFYTYPAKGMFELLPFITQWMVSSSIFISIVLLEIPFIQLINHKFPFLIGKKYKI